MNHATRRQILTFFWALLAGSCTAQGADVRFRAEAPIRGSLVLLGDVAEIHDPDPAVVAHLERIELFPAPARGRERRVRDVELRQLLRLHGIEPAAHRFSGAESIRIGGSIGVVQASTTTVAKPAVRNGSATPAATLVVVAKRAIRSGEVLRAIDVELKTVESLSPGVAPATDPADVVGLEAQRAWLPGQPIDPRSLRKPLLVKRGEAISVTAKAAGVRVRTTAKALADAAAGDSLPVENEKHDIITVVVTGRREAEILAAGPVASNPIRRPSNSQGTAE